MARRRKKKAAREEPDEKAELTGSQRWGRIGVYVISLLMLLSAFSYFTGQPPTQSTEQVDLSGVSQVQVRSVGNVSVLAHVAAPTDEYLAIPGADGLSRLNQDVLLGFVSANFSGVDDVAVELSDAYVMFRFTAAADFNLSAFDAAVGRRLRDYRIYRGYRAAITPQLPGVSEVRLIGEPGLAKGDAVSVMLLERVPESGVSSILAFQRGRVAQGPIVEAAVVSRDAYVVTGTFAEPSVGETLRDLGPPDANVTVSSPQLVVSAPDNDSRLVELSDDLDVPLLARDGNATALPVNSSTLEDVTAALLARNLTYRIENGSAQFVAPLDQNRTTLESLIQSAGAVVVGTAVAGTVELPGIVILEGVRAPIRDADAFPALLFLDSEVGDDIRVELDYLQLGNQILVYNAREVEY